MTIEPQETQETTEGRLRAAFDSCASEPSFALTPVDTIRGRGRGRRRRTRVLAAGLAIAAIAGVGLTLDRARPDDPSAVIVADVPAPNDRESVEPESTAGPARRAESQPAATGQAAESQTPAPTRPPWPTPTPVPALPQHMKAETEQVAGDAVARPEPFMVESDGTGGFFGVSPRYVGGRVEFVWSADGERWQTHSLLKVPGRHAAYFQRSGDRYFALMPVNPSTYTFVDSDTTLASRPNSRIQIGVSADLIEWEILDVPIEFPVIDLAFERFSVHPALIKAAVSNGRTLVQLGLFVEVHWQAIDGLRITEYCGQLDDERGVYVLHCDGSLIEVLSADDRRALGLEQSTRFFVRDDDGPLREITTNLAQDPFMIQATDGGFVTTVSGLDDQVQVSADGETWTTWTGSKALPAEWDWFPVTTGPGSQVLMFGADRDRGIDARIARIDVATGDVRIRAMPLQAHVSRVFQGAVYETEVWAMIAYVQASASWATDEWHVSRDGGWGDGPVFRVLAKDHFIPRYEFLDKMSSAAIDRGLFGELRFRRPGTGDVLVEVAGEDAVGSTPYRALASGPPGMVFAQNGWEISGPVSFGPLTIRSPGGIEVDYADGFAFTNGDFADGVELVGDNREFEDRQLVVRQDGAELSVPMSDVVAALKSQVQSQEAFDASAEPGDAWLLTSEDGVAWSVVWEQEDADLGDYPSIVIGDEEVLVRTSDQNDPLHRIPLPD